jgi:hypothetical protein
LANLRIFQYVEFFKKIKTNLATVLISCDKIENDRQNSRDKIGKPAMFHIIAMEISMHKFFIMNNFKSKNIKN